MSNSLHSEYCHCECPEGLSYAKLEETLNRVRLLHTYTVIDNLAFCGECANPDDEGGYWKRWPCPTMSALAGSDDV